MPANEEVPAVSWPDNNHLIRGLLSDDDDDNWKELRVPALSN